MTNFEQTLENLTSYIQAYDDVSLNDGESLNFLLQKINTTLFYLETERAIFKRKYESKVYFLTAEKKMTVARSINFAEVDVPELYLLRRIMDAGYRCSDAIRTHISFLKSEKRNA
jgi:cob(I)alamin adenosyltransferase